MYSDNQIRKAVEQAVDKVMEDCSKVLNTIYEKLYKDLNSMYKTYIQQFYSYETDLYVRHGESYAGTGVGHNLYEGNRIRKRRGTKDRSPVLDVRFSGEKMGGYEFNTADQVLEQVMGGIRFPETKKLRYSSWPDGRWTGSYSSSLTGRNYSGTMKEAFDDFEKNFDDIVEDLFYPAWEHMGY